MDNARQKQPHFCTDTKLETIGFSFGATIIVSAISMRVHGLDITH